MVGETLEANTADFLDRLVVGVLGLLGLLGPSQPPISDLSHR